ncbi:MAG: carbon storage regulator [Phycisphaerales bacterium]|nr:carbon storage regulator [Phycisphaerales bacterium]
MVATEGKMGLVLSRHRDEQIYVCDRSGKVETIITVVDIRGDKVRIGVNAPQDRQVHRREIYEQIQRERPPRNLIQQ